MRTAAFHATDRSIWNFTACVLPATTGKRGVGRVDYRLKRPGSNDWKTNFFTWKNNR
jgi:hypothetical protein